MSLPIAGRKVPTREPTHTALDAGRLMTLAGNVEAALDNLGETQLTPAIVEEIAGELGVRDSHVYAAIASMSGVPCASDAEIRIELCVGNCQRWGALDLLDRVLDVHGRRRFQDAPAFSVVAKSCLDRCADAAVVIIRTPDGNAGLTATTIEQLDAALTELGMLDP